MLDRALTIGSRGSRLALAQAEEVAAALRRAWPDLEVRLEVIRAEGDEGAAEPSPPLGAGIFTSALSRAVAEGRADCAVHSAKDLPTQTHAGCVIAAAPPRASVLDAWISADGASLADAAPGTVVGTGSPRRRAQLLGARPDLTVVPIRGNIDTRLRKLAEGDVGALVVARAGLERLGWEDRITQELSPDVMTPAVGQGALAVEVRRGDAKIASFLAPLDDPPTHAALDAERAFLRALGGGCRAPIAAWAKPIGGALRMMGLVASPDGDSLVRETVEGSLDDPEALGARLAAALEAQGAAALFETARI